MDTVVSSVADLRQVMDAKVAEAMDEIKRLIMNNGVVGGEAQSSGVAAGDRAPAAVPDKNEEYHLPTRGYQVEFPSFDGEGLKDWLYKCEQFFYVDDTPEGSKEKLASCRLEGKALQWHQSYMKHRLTRDWPRWSEYVGYLYARFGSELLDDPMGDFKDLRQVNSVQDM